MVHAGASEGCLAVCFGRTCSCITPCTVGMEHQRQHVPPDGEPPATALKGTICWMVSLVLGVKAREWRRKGSRSQILLEFNSGEGRG